MKKRHSLLFHFFCQALRALFIVLLSASAVSLILAIFGGTAIAGAVIEFLTLWWPRLAACSFLGLGTSIIFESLR